MLMGMFFTLVVLMGLSMCVCMAEGPAAERALDAVVLTAADAGQFLFPYAMESAMKHLVDVRKFYVVCTKSKDLQAAYGAKWGDRVKFVHQRSLGFTFKKIQQVIQTVVDDKVQRVDPTAGRSNFKAELERKSGWYLQQLAKLHAGSKLGLDGDYVVLDADIVWHQDVALIDRSATARDKYDGMNRYLYAYSTQYHGPYASTMQLLLGIRPREEPHKSGIVHHLVVVKEVMAELTSVVEARYGIPLWQAMLNVSGDELTRQLDPGGGVTSAEGVSLSGKGSVLSEFDMYFHYALQKWPKTVTLRPLMWANGPQNNRLYWPTSSGSGREHGQLPPDSQRGGSGVWLPCRGDDVPHQFPRQLEADRLSGYHFVAYHSYASRRYYELYSEDVLASGACANVSKQEQKRGPAGSTCSWLGYDKSVKPEEWFRGCMCYQFINRQG